MDLLYNCRRRACWIVVYLGHPYKYSLQSTSRSLVQLTENGQILHNFQLIWDTTDDLTRVTRLHVCTTTKYAFCKETQMHPLYYSLSTSQFPNNSKIIKTITSVNGAVRHFVMYSQF